MVGVGVDGKECLDDNSFDDRHQRKKQFLAVDDLCSQAIAYDAAGSTNIYLDEKLRRKRQFEG